MSKKLSAKARCSITVAGLMLIGNLPAPAADPPISNSSNNPGITRTFGLSVQDIGNLMQNHFQLSQSASAIPVPVLRELSAHDIRLMKTLRIYAGTNLPDPYTGPLLKMADAGKPFNSTDCINPNLPWQRLLFVATTSQVCLLAYETGGGWTDHVVLAVFHLSKTASGKDQASLVDAVIPNHDFKSIEELRKAVESHQYSASNCIGSRLL